MAWNSVRQVRQGYGSDELVQAIRFADALVTRGEQPRAVGLSGLEAGQAAYLALLSALLGFRHSFAGCAGAS